MADNALQEKLERLVDRTEIFELVRFERLCRDQRNFSGMLACYVANAPVRTTWFDDVVEDFVEASRKKMTSGSQAKHWIMPARLEIEGVRALVESPALIFDRLTLDGIEFDTFQYCRFVSRVIETADGWKLGSFEGIYQRDQMQAVDPRNPLPVDWDVSPRCARPTSSSATRKSSAATRCTRSFLATTGPICLRRSTLASRNG